jgi:hypothetical protein
LTDLFKWGAWDEVERRIRIRLSLYAYAYEIAHAPIASDSAFDALAMQSNPSIITGRYDEWWREHFKPYTGQWIHNHPDLPGIARLYRRLR